MVSAFGIVRFYQRVHFEKLPPHHLKQGSTNSPEYVWTERHSSVRGSHTSNFIFKLNFETFYPSLFRIYLNHL